MPAVRSRDSVAGTSADPIVQTASLELDGETHRLVYSFNAIALAEKVAGCNLLSGLENLGSLTAIQLRGLLYAAMTPMNAGVTVEQAGALIRLDTIGPITKALAEAYALSVPDKKVVADPPEAGAPAVS